MWGRIVLLAAVAAVALANEDFKGYTVIRVTPQGTEQEQAVYEYLQDNPTLDVWAMSREMTDVNLSPEQREEFVSFLDTVGIKHEVFLADVQKAVQRNLMSVQKSTKAAGDFGFTSYYRLEQIYEWMQSLADANPKVVSVVNAGNSYQGNPIKGIVIKFKENLPVAFIESGIHAREWIAPASATYFINEILQGSSNSATDAIVRSYEWHIFPVVNPDGYIHSWNSNRNWRKTRSPHMILFRGVDANRNWPYKWMKGGATRNPAAETFGGPKAESEPETKALRKYVDSLTERMHVYVSLHSYSQMLMFPWGYTNKKTPLHNKLNNIAAKAVSAVRALHGRDFQYGNIADTIYIASGSTIDYVHSKCVPFPFVYELRDKGQHGFLLPPEQIIEGAGEAWEGVKVIVTEAWNDGVPSKNPTTCKYD